MKKKRILASVLALALAVLAAALLTPVLAAAVLAATVLTVLAAAAPTAAALLVLALS